MSNKVRILDDVVVNQIAAGEVVERPSSVVKELFENSLDAGADEIIVVVDNGGHSSIVVRDNGCGMSEQDALLSIERFGTSKIRSIDDLYAIRTMGFRGEALSSIASVSRFSLLTRSDKDETGMGTEIVIEGGKIKNVLRHSISKGTEVRVKNLFFNVPARKKFLKSDATEVGLIKSQLYDFALSHCHIRISLVVDGVEAIMFNACSGFEERVKQLRFHKSDSLFINTSREVVDGKLAVNAILSSPINSAAAAGSLRLLVNGRSVRDKLLLRAVRDAYGNYLKPGRYPQGALMLEVPHCCVDVNVHPQKAEVRFRDSGEVFSFVRSAIEKSFKHVLPYSSAGDIKISQEANSSSQFFQTSKDLGYRNSYAAAVGQDWVFEGTEYNTKLFEKASDENNSHIHAIIAMRYIGQIFSLYLLFEGKQKLAIVDMHAAHERVMFFKLKSQYEQGQIVKQALLFPEVIEIPPQCVADIDKSFEVLSKIGVDCEKISDSQLIVRAMPSLLGEVSASAVFADLFSLENVFSWKHYLANRNDSIFATLACHGSVRSGRSLHEKEVTALLESLAEAESSAFCPHGRPVVSFISEKELELMFGRRL